MAYALFAQKKLMYTGLINTVQNQQMQRSEEQMKIATNTLNLQTKISTLQDEQTNELQKWYEALAGMKNENTDSNGNYLTDDKYLQNATTKKYEVSTDSGADHLTRSKIEDQIRAIEEKFESEIAAENRKISFNTTKENLIEMQVKRLDTRITALKKQLEKIEEAEGDGIDKATPKFKGIG